ncbi:MAG: Uma2 family endonuclease [Mucilaginibacter sp.]|jgi:Uma2 family endonuclease|nr:Uma2 family endonuclease [Mucilaginibacter sp.]
MLTVEKKKKYTVDDYMMLEEGAPFQLINNELIMSPSPNSIHQAIVARLSKIILIFLESEQKGGYTAGSMDVVFDKNNVFQPDFLYVSEERVDEIVKERVEGSPDMAIEILSPSNAYYDLIQKKEVYEKYGVKEYIIFDPIAKNAHLYALKDGIYYLHQKAQQNELLHSLILPGFSFDLTYIFK